MTTIDREFPTRVVLSVATGRGIPGAAFTAIHECITHVLGWDVFTHELADPRLWDQARANIAEANWHVDIYAREANARETVADFVASIDFALANLPATVWLPKGSGKRAEHPMESASRLAPGKTVIGVKVSDPTTN